MADSEYNRNYYKANRDRVISVNRAYYVKNKKQINELQKKARKSLNGRWGRLKTDAKLDGRNVGLTKEDFSVLTSQRCFYCGEMSPGECFVGLDRIDSAKDYDLGNVVPCCTPCNMMKRDMTISSWFDRMEKILAFSGRAP